MWQIVVNGPAFLDSTVFLPEGVTTLGRAPESDIVLTGNSVSRAHARLEVKSDGLYVVDLGSRNGSQVNGTPLKGAALLRAGDTISLGEFNLQVRHPARVENLLATEVDPHAGGIRRVPAPEAPLELVAIKRPGTSGLAKALDLLSVPDADDSGAVPLPPAYRTLILLQESADRVDNSTSLQEFLDESLGWLQQRLGATSALVLLRHASGAVVPVGIRHEGLVQGEVPVHESVLETAAQRRAAIAVRDPSVEKKAKSKEPESQVLCAPITSSRASGALYLIRPPKKDDELDELLDALNALAHLTAIAVERFLKEERGRRNDRLKKTLQRFHAPDIIERRVQDLSRSGREQLTQMELRPLSVLVADLAGFTALIEQLKPDRVVDLLNEFYRHTTRVIFSFEGTVDKFVGDSVMALFGAPYPIGDHPVRALRCALSIRTEWQKAMNRRPVAERCALQIGVHSGTALVGTVGTEARLDYTAVGETVNLAAWISAYAEPGQILASRPVVEAGGGRFDSTTLGDRAVGRASHKIWLANVLGEDEGHMVTEQFRRP